MNIQYKGQDKNGDGIYEIRIYCGLKEGKPIRKTKTIHAKNERAAKRQLENLLRSGDLPDIRVESGNDTTFEQFARIWRQKHGNALARRTQIMNQSIIDRYLLDMFGKKKLTKIRTEDIRVFIDCLRSLEFDPDHPPYRKHLSDTMIHKCFRLLSHILQKAVEWRYLSINPCNKLGNDEKPKPDYHHAPIWQKEELSRFLSYLDTLPPTYGNLQKKAMFYTILITGLRKGELSVLNWQDIDLEEKSISITKSLKYMDSKEIDIAAPKTKSSKRKVFFDDYVKTLLQELRDKQSDYLLELREENPQHFVFITQRRKTNEIIPVTPSYLYMWLRKAAKRCELPPIDVHSIRHMAATYALASGAPITGVQNMMGHTSLRTTSIYIHMLDEQRRETASTLSSGIAALRGKQNQ